SRSEVVLWDEDMGRYLSSFRDDMVVVFSDHGRAYGEDGLFNYGWSVHEPAIRVPLWVHSPGLHIPETVRDSAFSTKDVAAIIHGRCDRPPYVIADTRYYRQPYREV